MTAQLIPFAQKPKSTDPYRDLTEPPDDAIEGAKWVSSLLRRCLYDVALDPTLDKSRKRDLVLKYSNMINKATPNEELYRARESLREDENEIKGTSLKGEVTTRATKRSPRRLRSE